MRYYQKRPSQQPRHLQPEEIFRRYDDGREVCLNNEAGRSEYELRKQLLWQRQQGACGLDVCGGKMSLADCRMTSGDWSETGQLRDDRIQIGGRDANGLVHKDCLRRWHQQQHGQQVPATVPTTSRGVALFIVFLLALLTTPSTASAQAALSGQAITPFGGPAASAKVRVCAITSSGVPCSPVAQLYSDFGLTQPLPNPLSTDQYGNYKFFLASGTYNIQIALAGAGQPTYVYYATAGGSGGGGGGSVTFFSAGNLSPLFSTAVSNPSTTPGLSFTLLTTPNFTFYGNFSGGTAVPKFWTLAAGANVTLTPAGGNTLTIAATGGGTSTCGPVEGDATSTDCGTGNLIASTGTERSTYGDGNANTATANDLIGIGDATTSHISGTDIIGIGDTASQYITGTDWIGLGDEALFGDATRLRTGHDVIGIGHEAVSVGSASGTTNLADVVGIGASAGLDISGSNLSFVGNQAGAHSSGTDIIGMGTTASSNVISGTSIIGVGDAASADQGAGNADIVGVGDGTSARTGAGSNDIVGMGDGSAANLAAGSSDVVGIGDGAGSQPFGGGTSVANVVAIGDGAGGSNNGNEFIGIGTLAGECNNANNTIALGALAVGGGLFSTNCNSAQVTGNENIGIGDHADTANTSGTDNVAIGDSSGADGYVNSGSVGHSNVTGSHNTWLGAKTGPNTATQLSNTIGLGYQAFNTQSNQTVIGNPSITQLIIFGSGDGCLSSSSGVITGSGVACGSGGGGAAFSAITGSTNTTANMVVGSGAALSTAGSGTIAATSVGGIVVTGTPAIGNVLTATSTSAANWQALAAGGTVTNFIASSGSWPTWLVPTVTSSTTTPTLSVAAGAIPNSALAIQSANTVLGAVTATTPSGLAMPSCSGGTNALIWTTGTGFGCNTISGGGAVSSVSNSDGTLTISPTTGAVVASLALGHVNTWTGVQTLNSPILVTPALGTIASGVGTALTALNGSNVSSGTVAAARLPTFGSAAAGIVPLSGGGTTNFLRADGTWAAPPGGSGGCTSVGAQGVLQAAGSTTGTCQATAVTDNGATVTSTEPVAVNASGTPSQINMTPSGTAVAAVAGASALGAPDTVVTAGVYQLPGTPATGLYHFVNTAGKDLGSISLVAIADLSATGTPSSTTYLRGDNTWATIGGTGGCTFSVFGTNNYNICGALPGTATGHDLTASGANSMAVWTSATVSTAYGQSALAAFASTGGHENAFGSGALQNFNSANGPETALGSAAMFAATTIGNDNIAVGDTALGGATSIGHDNIAIGDNALEAETNSSNIGIGSNALEVASGQPNNVAVGVDAMLSQTSGFDNVCMGNLCEQQNTTGFENTAIGHQAAYGTGLATISASVFLGYLATSTTDGLSDMIVIGSNAQGTASNQVTLGDTGITSTILRGLVREPAAMSSGTKFTTSGCSVSSTTGGASAGIFTLGANSCTVIITMNGATGLTATNGWTCQAHDRTLSTLLLGGESSSTTTTASITIPVTAGATDVISFSCTAF